MRNVVQAGLPIAARGDIMVTGQGWMTPLKAITKKDQCRITVDHTIEDAIGHMMTTETGVVVFIEEEKPVGVLTERDVVSFLHTGISLKSPLSAVKHTPLTVTEDKTLLFGLNMLIGNNIRRIIVVNSQGNFVGVVTHDDLIRLLEGELYRQDARIMDIISSKQSLRTVLTEESLSAAIDVMTNHRVGSVLVMDKGKVVGIITERDILRIAGNKTLLSEKAGAFMSHPVVSASIDSSILDVLEIMKVNNIRRILINYSDGIPFRVISNRDILRNLDNSYLEFLNSKIRHAREILDFLPEIIVEVIDVSGEQVIQWCNRKTQQEFGRDMANLPITNLIPSETWATVYPSIIDHGKIEKAKIEIGDKTFELSASYMKMQREGIIQAILINVTSEVYMSTSDFLTGIYNRRKFDEILSVEIERVNRYEQFLSIGILDIDHFKIVNDTYGHQAGDKVLQELTKLIAQHIRKVDYLARYGGEEFVILSPNTGLTGMYQLAEKLRHTIEAHAFHGQNRITISLGVAQYSFGETKPTFIERADAALYQAKAKGRNRVECS
jgi:diguanylate cyclase (GGDEF)-like protein